MRILIAVAAFVGLVSVAAADLTLTASGFPAGHVGNGTFVLKQQKNADGTPINCWSQEAQSEVQWQASYCADGKLLRAVFSRNGNIIADYQLLGFALGTDGAIAIRGPGDAGPSVREDRVMQELP